MKKLVIAIISTLFIMTLLFPAALARPDIDRPLPATEVELIKKVTVRGKPVGGGKPTNQAATGVIGADCQGKRYAIVLGVSDYPGSESDLEYSDDDAQDMYYALTEIYEFNPDNVKLLVDMDASFDAVKMAINSLKSTVQEKDEVVFFFSGHGARGQADGGDKERKRKLG